MKRVEVGVMKVETWEEANWSTRLRYLLPFSSNPSAESAYCEERKRVHLIVGPVQLVHEIQAAMYDERVHAARLLAETGDAIAALLGSAKFELKQRLVSRADYTEVVRHAICLKKGDRYGGQE